MCLYAWLGLFAVARRPPSTLRSCRRSRVCGPLLVPPLSTVTLPPARTAYVSCFLFCWLPRRPRLTFLVNWLRAADFLLDHHWRFADNVGEGVHPCCRDVRAGVGHLRRLVAPPRRRALPSVPLGCFRRCRLQEAQLSAWMTAAGTGCAAPNSGGHDGHIVWHMLVRCLAGPGRGCGH